MQCVSTALRNVRKLPAQVHMGHLTSRCHRVLDNIMHTNANNNFDDKQPGEQTWRVLIYLGWTEE